MTEPVAIGILAKAPKATMAIDGANLYKAADFAGTQVKYVGIGRGKQKPSPEFIDFVEKSFIAVEKGTANEVKAMAEFLNGKYAASEFNKEIGRAHV